MNIPSPAGGRTTTQVGFFDFAPAEFAEWLLKGLGDRWELRRPEWHSMDIALTALEPSGRISLYACVPAKNWTLVLNNSPLGTDVGLLPSYAARELSCRAIRAVSVGRDFAFPARILEVYGPDGQPPLLLRRAIAASNDGGRWIFETSGEPFNFEDLSAYSHRIKSARFTEDMLYTYLRELGAPTDTRPDWRESWVVQLLE